MANRFSTRKRAFLVASAATAAVLAATTIAGAHEGVGDADVLHLCVKDSNGQLRAVGSSGNCRRDESPVHLPLESGDDGELVAFMAALLQADGPTDLVHWTNLAGVPEGLQEALPLWLADGEVDLAEIEGLPSWLADGQVSFDEIQGSLAAGSVTGTTVEDGSLTGTDVEDGALFTADLAGRDGAEPVPGAVTSEKVLDGTLTGRDIANGSINAVELNPVVASSTAGPGPLLPGGVDVPAFGPAVVEAPASGLVMVTGQVQLSLTSCVTCTPTVEYQLVRTGGAGPVPVSPIYEVQLWQYNSKDVASVAIMDSVGAGAHGYQIRLLPPGDGSVITSGAVVNVQLLGLTG